MPTYAYYMLFYILILAAAITGAALHVISPDVAASAFTFIIGHATGVVTPQPAKGIPNGQ